jgi:hypothetical protein
LFSRIKIIKPAWMKALAERLGEHEEIFREYSSLYT